MSIDRQVIYTTRKSMYTDPIINIVLKSETNLLPEIQIEIDTHVMKIIFSTLVDIEDFGKMITEMADEQLQKIIKDGVL